ncbi:KLTH0D00374p [Lachancea thermotolerans CBS 6340]|uniref:KLTH0D00374p n=1 Tax=Lachancea thermotolerans (strain ATCC 56472 / CBS 6340 / NRRL Y-8284) TaxID=559295 RepID=C5DFW0_LACTC|nr:KLTH0D00374p [Lachancea thermotolerans CBS 6340]CAR22302.1 KLTH0D00374p [Lachancea thermotolerans CBS 6340]
MNKACVPDKEAQNDFLPKFFYKSSLRWALDQLMRMPLFYLLLSSIVIDIVWFSIGNKLHSFWIHVPVFSSLLLQIKVTKAISNSIQRLCEIVIEEGPGMQEEQWDIAAARMNSHFYEQGLWPNSCCLYSGRQCHAAFRHLVMTPYNKKEEQIQASYSLDQQLPLEEQAAKVYIESVSRWWNTYTANLESSAQFHIENTLPQQEYRSKASWCFFKFIEVVMGQSSFGGMCFYSILLSLFFTSFTSFKNYDSLLGVWIGNAAGFSICGPLLFFVLRGADLDAPHLMAFWASVVAIEPHGDINKWGLVASHTNHYWNALNEESPRNFFFDSMDCRKAFKNRFSTSLLRNKGNSHIYSDLRKYIEEALEASKEINEK